jgi:hypothetical protein
MAVFTERQAIQQRMTEIREERRELGNEYYRLMDRLRELDTQEKEAVDIDGVVGSLTEAIKTLQSLVPHIPADALIKQVAQMVNEGGVGIIEETEEQKPQVAPAHVISHQQQRDAEKHLTEKPRRVGKLKSDDLNQMIIDVMKDKGVPMKLADIQTAVEEKVGYEINGGTFHNRMNNIMISNSKVEKPMRGYYQYKM